jgi:hypothetical protein
MKDVKQINFDENRQAIAEEIRSAFGAALSQNFVEEWVQIIINEAETAQYNDYSMDYTDSGELFFAQYGEKEHYHDGSCEPRKFVFIASISEEEYTEAQKHQCVLEREYHEYRNGWLDRGDERFFTYWQGRFSDYIYYAKNIAGIPFVRIKIEKLY